MDKGGGTTNATMQTPMMETPSMQVHVGDFSHSSLGITCAKVQRFT